MPSSLRHLLPRFAAQHVLVVGDLILDHYVRGSVSRTSPEAPVPVLKVEGESWLAGGAANVARNLAAQGARVTLVGVVGEDEPGERLLRALEDEPLIRPRLVRDRSRPTTVKTRCVAQGQQMLRLDREDARPVPGAVEAKLLSLCDPAKFSGCILSDYGKGVLGDAVVAQMMAKARRAGREVFVDPKGFRYERYAGATCVTPNAREAAEAAGHPVDDDESLARAARALRRKIRGGAICITRGAQGASVFPPKGRATHVASRAREVFDVTGAGDTFIALMALARFAGAEFGDAAELANIAAGIKVAHAGVVAVTPEELLLELLGGGEFRKLRTLDELSIICQHRARAGRRVVFTNGCFDLLHAGHIRLLERARALGDVLIVALNTDASIRRLKGEPRPVLDERERAELLSALPQVDYIVLYDGDTPKELLRKLRPDVLVKGAATGDANVVGREIVEAYGGTVRLVATEVSTSADGMMARIASRRGRA